MGFLKLLNRNSTLPWTKALVYLGGRIALSKGRFYSSYTEEPEMEDFLGYLDSLTNYEKSGVPKDAGTDSDDGLDLGRMRRLMDRLGNPQSKFKAVHIAGTKGKGSTAAFLSSIFRAEGYSVGSYTSPHITTIRERISLGKSGDPVSAKTLNGLFQRIKPILDEAIHRECGRLTHFEILTATAFTLMAAEDVAIAVIEAGLGGARDATNVISSSELAASVITTIGAEHLVALGGSLESIAMAKAGIIKRGRPLILGGPFLPYIECILRDQAISMCSPVVSACDAGISCTTKSIEIINGRPSQLCDIVIKVERDFPMFIELSDLKLRMLGCHQLENATTAVCTALSLRNQGWNISDGAIKAGLENTCLLGRSQFLSEKEAEALGLPGATVLLDGAHTKESAKALVDMIRTTFPGARLGLVVAMASDKDHLAFAKEFLYDRDIQLEAVFLTEADIAGGKSRTTSASLLRDCWIQASKELGLDDLQPFPGKREENKIILSAEKSLEASMREVNRIIRERAGARSTVIVVTGSLHIVSLALAPLVVTKF